MSFVDTSLRPYQYSPSIEEFRDSYNKWYVSVHPYIAKNGDFFDGNRDSQYLAWIELKTWFPVMEPGYEKRSKFFNQELSELYQDE